MLKAKNIIKVITVIVVLSLICSLPTLLACKHENTTIVTTTAPTCTLNGLEDIVCIDCETILETRKVPSLGHSYGEYVVTREPILNDDGVELRTCERCGREDYRVFECKHEDFTSEVVKEPTCIELGSERHICSTCGIPWYTEIEKTPHLESYTTIIKEATCYSEGIEHVLCSLCSEVLEEHSIPVISCTYGDWKFTKYATPVESGERYKSCIYCGHTKSETYTMSMPSANSIYIPGTGLCHSVTPAGFTQEAVNSYNIVLAHPWGASDPFILGHNTGSMWRLPSTRIGQLVYLSIKGQIEIYEVVVSEHARTENDARNIIGYSTGHDIWDSVGTKTLHMYTCYGDKEKDERWIVLAKLVS